MAKSPFQSFPTERGPVKLFVYGEPGTLKTRRSLGMPGPLFVIDMEGGACDYADLIDPKRDKYLSTKSHTEVADAVNYATSLPAGSVGTLIIDPITVVWQSLQMGHVERMAERKKIESDEVDFDVGVWGKLKRLYGDLMTDLLNAPFHVVCIARGAEKTDGKGKKLPYGYDGEKNTVFLMKTVIETHDDHDIVIKDRTGTFATRQIVDGRADFLSLLSQAGPSGTRMQSDSEAARRDARDPAPATPDNEVAGAIRAAASRGWTKADLLAALDSYGVGKGSDLKPDHIPGFLTLLSGAPLSAPNNSPEAK